MTLQREIIFQRLLRRSINQTSAQTITSSRELAELIERTILPRKIVLISGPNLSLSLEVTSGRVFSIASKELTDARHLEALDTFCAKALPAELSVTRANWATIEHQGFTWTPGDTSRGSKNAFWLFLKEAASCYIETKNAEITARVGPDDDLAFLSRFAPEASQFNKAPQCAIFSAFPSDRQSLVVGNANSDGMVALIPGHSVVDVTREWQMSL